MNKLIMAALLLPALWGCGNEPAEEVHEAIAPGQELSEAKAIEVPAIVSNAFVAQFPDAMDVVWEMEDATTYEAGFKRNDVQQSASYAADGTWLETEMTLNPLDLPAAVQEGISTGYAGHVTKEAEELTRPSGTFYEVELEQDGHTMEVVYTSEGIVVNNKVEQAEEEQD